MSELTSLHAQSKRLILLLREDLERLEVMEHGPRSGDTSRIAADLQVKLGELRRISQEMDGMWRMQVVRENSTKRDVWKRKVEQVGEEVLQIRSALDKYSSREQRRQREAQERDELMAGAAEGRRLAREMDEEAALMGSSQRANQQLNELYETGANILSTMAGSRERLKRAHRKVLDVINSVGLGESVLKLIERRQRMDIWVTYGGMVVVLLITVGMMWWAWS